MKKTELKKSKKTKVSVLKQTKDGKAQKKRVLNIKQKEKVPAMKKPGVGKMERDTFALKIANDREFRKEYVTRKKIIKKRYKDTIQKSQVIFLSNIPYGFFEKEMREFFSQFGIVLNCRHVLSERSGHSCGYGYVKFLVPEVAQIVAKSMDGYLTLGKIMKCQVVEPRRVSPKFFDGENITKNNFPTLIRRKQAIHKLNRPRHHQMEARRLERLTTSYQQKVKGLADLGINLDLLKHIGVAEDNEEEKVEAENEVEEENCGSADEEMEEVEETEEERKERKAVREELTAKIQKNLRSTTLGAEDVTEKLVLEVDESDDEIQFKTPPHAIKKFVKMTNASPKIGVKKSAKSPHGTAKKKKTVNLKNNKEEGTPSTPMAEGTVKKIKKTKKVSARKKSLMAQTPITSKSATPKTTPLKKKR